jgi:hypothetical protein
MLAVLVVALITWVVVLNWRRARFLELSWRYREQATIYARMASEHVDAIALVADLERVVAGAEPPAAGSEIGAFRAYREYIADLQRRMRIADSELDAYGGYCALRRHCEQLAAKHERAAMRPWLGVEAGACDVE